MVLMIAISHLVKSFGALRAVDDVSFTVAKGEVLGFLGPNGAGKSTTMKMLAGFLSPSSGSAQVCGFDVVENPIQAKQQIGYLPEGAPAYPDMTARSFLRFVAEIRGFQGAERERRVGRAVEMANLRDVVLQPIETLSKGYKRRVGLAQALLHDPPVLVMDEPTDGLDPNQKHEVRRLIETISSDKAIIVSTHILEEVEAVCSRALIISRGRVVADGTPDELVARDPDHDSIILTLRQGSLPIARQALSGLGLVGAIEERPPEILIVRPVVGQGRTLLADIGRLAQAENWDLLGIRLERGRLDRVFRQITQAAS